MTKHHLKDAAEYLASKGRYGDTMLVHMNPEELKWLAAKSPTGKLTINPDTGQPEAFLPFLAPILGSLAGGALASAVPALGISTALGAGLGSGLASFAATGDLTKGITSGLMGYGLGSMTDLLAAGSEGIAGAGTEAAKEAARNAAATAPNVAIPGSSAGVDYQIAQQGLNGAGAGSGLNVPTTNYAPGPVADLIAKNMPAPHVAAQTDASMLDPFTKFSKAAENVTNPDVLKNTFWTNASKTTVPIGMGLVGDYMMGGGQGQVQGQQQPYQATYPYPGNQGTGRKYTYQDPSPMGYERRYFNYADGGRVDPGRSEYEQDDRYDFSTRAGERGSGLRTSGPRTMTLREAEEWAKKYDASRSRGYGSLTSPSPFDNKSMPPVLQYAKGGYIGGPGGGLDDAIPAVIDGRQPAKLSSGEYVVPAHAVSALGNGSTEHGVRELDRMVDRTMQGKFGTKNRKPRPINPQKVMAGLGAMKGAGKKAAGPFDYQLGGVIDRLFGTGAKMEGRQDPGRSWDMDPMVTPWPSAEEGAAAREYKRRYGNSNEEMISGPRMVNRQYEEPGRLVMQGTPNDVMGWVNGESYRGIRAVPLTQDQADELYAGQLGAQSDPVSYLGYNVGRMIINNPRRGPSWRLNGAYAPKEDVLMYGGQSPTTMAHESMHRGLEMLKQENPDLGIPRDDEYLVRRMMKSRFGPLEYERGLREGVKDEDADKNLIAAMQEDKKTDAYIKKVRKKAHETVAKKVVEREGGVK